MATRHAAVNVNNIDFQRSRKLQV